MKIPLAMFLISTLQFIIECKEIHDPNKVLKLYSHHVKIPVQRSIKIINARKFEKLRDMESRKANIKKKDVEKRMYTVFPPISERRLLDVPDDVLIQEQPNGNRKPRVKKVLSVFRKRRSAHDMNAESKETDKTQKLKRKKLAYTVKSSNKTLHAVKQRRNSKRRSKLKSKMQVTQELSTFVKEEKREKILKASKENGFGREKSRFKSKPKHSTKTHKNNPRLKDMILSSVKSLKESDGAKYHKERKVRIRRLIAARDAEIESYPYVVSIQKNQQHWCAGAILNPRLVITTANCVWKSRSMSRMRIRAGSRYVNRGGQVAKIYEVVKHPSWSIRSQPDNDVALLLLDRNIKFSDSVHEVDLPNRAMWPVFEDAWVTSWGAERRDGIFNNMDGTLQVYHAKLLDHERCNNVTQRFGVTVSHNFICLAQTGRRAPCTRDTGAPAVSDGILWGLASWGIRKLCGTERYPAMFSYLASRSNLDFITNATHYLMSDKRFYPYPDRFPYNAVVPTTTAVNE